MASALNYITRECLEYADLPIAFGRTVVALAPGDETKLNVKGRDPWYVNETVHLQLGFFAAAKHFESGPGLQVKNWVSSRMLGRHAHGRVIRDRFPHVVNQICFLVNDIRRFCRDTNQPAGRSDALAEELNQLFAFDMDLDKMRGLLEKVYPGMSLEKMDASMRRLRVLLCDYLAVHVTTAKARSMWLRHRDGNHPSPPIEVSIWNGRPCLVFGGLLTQGHAMP
jgi:hypothetical protein